MLNQSFFREMTDEAVRLKVDYLAMFAGTIFLAATVLFQEAFISVFFNKGSVLQSTSLVLLGCTGFLIAPFISLHTSVLLERKDRLFSRLSLLGIVVAASACMISSFIFNGADSILFSLLLGEFVIVAGLITICNKKNLFLPRLAFFRRNLPLLVIPIGSRILFGDNTYSFIGSLCVYGVLFLTTNWKSFILHKQEKEMRLYES
jgi:O-antigen/teichoic acid export membrane protein